MYKRQEDESPVHQIQDIIPTINVYPNPATKSLALKIENPEEYIFEIYDGAGNKMIVNTNNPNHIETDLLLPGLYIVKATNRSYDFTLYKSFIKIQEACTVVLTNELYREAWVQWQETEERCV